MKNPTPTTKTDRTSHKKLSTSSHRCQYTVTAKSHTLTLGHKTHIMGIVNVTPDSFSQDGQYDSKKDHTKAIRYARKLIREGADILDIGGESSRPGAEQITVKEELARVIPVIEDLSSKITVPISIDTYKPAVAKQALKSGASIVNNIKGTELNPKLLATVKDTEAALILMHMRGQPKNMQKNTQYNDIIKEIYTKLQKSIENCLDFGIKSDKLIIDPGIGFGKSVLHNLLIINRLEEFKSLNCPLLIGTSRKSFIGNILNKETHQRLYGSIASISTSIMNGAHIVRVHDIKETKDAVMVIDSIINEQQKN